MKLTIEKGSGVAMTTHNLLIKDEMDMEFVEFWEERLERLEQPYIIGFREIDGKIAYSIYTNLKSKESKFR